MLAREDGHWAVALAGRGDDLPPADGDGFLAFAAGLETSTIHDAIKGAKRHGEVVQFAFPESRRRHFNRIADFPRGLIPIGDSVCRFNPIYGQGMSIAAQEAVLLRDLLAAHVGEADPFATLGAKFLSGIEPLIESPWGLSALPDLAYPDARGERPAELGKALEYQVALSRAAYRDPDINKLMIEVLNLMKPASALNAPDVVQVVTG